MKKILLTSVITAALAGCGGGGGGDSKPAPVNHAPTYDCEITEVDGDGEFKQGETMAIIAKFADQDGNLKYGQLSVITPEGKTVVIGKKELSGESGEIEATYTFVTAGTYNIGIEVRDEKTATKTFDSIDVEKVQDIPWTPIDPSEPINPDIPWTPIDPSEPINPDIPWTPIDPSEPINPDIPWTPIEPSDPVEPEPEPEDSLPTVKVELEDNNGDGVYEQGEYLHVTASFQDQDGDLSFGRITATTPEGRDVIMSEFDLHGSRDSVVDSIILEKHGKYVFMVDVRDKKNHSTVNVREVMVEPDIPNNKPKAYARVVERSKLGGCYELNGKASSDPDGQTITYNWTVTKAPELSEAVITNPNAEVTSLCPDIGGEYEVTLVVNDGEDDSDPVSKSTIVGTYISGAYLEDLTLNKKDSPYIVMEQVQIGKDATMTVESGVEIHPNRNPETGDGRSIEVFGEALVMGTKDEPVILNVAMETKGKLDAVPVIKVSFAEIGEDAFPTNSQAYGSVVVKDSIINTPVNEYVWYPKGYLITRNTFNESSDFRIGIDARDHNRGFATLENNLFKKKVHITSWAAYGGEVAVHNNTFVEMPKLELTLGYSDCAIKAIENFWPTKDETAIQEAILDQNDDLNREGFIEYLPLLEAPHELTPTP